MTNHGTGCSSSGLAGVLDVEAPHQVQTGRTEDHREAAKAFAEQRAPFPPAGEPAIDREALPSKHRSPNPLWLHEEIELVGAGPDRNFRLSILLDNGWEITLPIGDLQIQTLVSLFPVPRNGFANSPTPSVPQTVLK